MTDAVTKKPGNSAILGAPAHAASSARGQASAVGAGPARDPRGGRHPRPDGTLPRPPRQGRTQVSPALRASPRLQGPRRDPDAAGELSRPKAKAGSFGAAGIAYEYSGESEDSGYSRTAGGLRIFWRKAVDKMGKRRYF